MAISDRTRKLLWGRAGDRCAVCRRALSRDAEHAADRIAVLGEECHIVARSSGGPRSGVDVEDLDGYDNLILLCANDHAVVDEHAAGWGIERLRETKANHERWVETRLSTAGVLPELHWRPGTRRTELEVIRSGSSLMRLYGRTFAISVRRPERLDGRARALVGTIFGTAEEWADIWDEVPMGQQLEIEADLDDALDELEAEGFVVLGGIRHMLLATDDREVPWPEALILVRSSAELQEALGADGEPSAEQSPSD